MGNEYFLIAHQIIQDTDVYYYVSSKPDLELLASPDDLRFSDYFRITEDYIKKVIQNKGKVYSCHFDRLLGWYKGAEVHVCDKHLRSNRNYTELDNLENLHELPEI